MTQGGFFEARRISPSSLTLVIAMHAAALGALALSKGEIIPKSVVITEAWNIPATIPEEVPPSEPGAAPEQKPRPEKISVPQPEVALPVPPTNGPAVDATPEVGTGPVGPAIPVHPLEVREPVRIEADVDPQFADRLQPPYPLSEQRAGAEGVVKVRVRIGTDGRVREIQKLQAASAAFWQATERHALRNWRFRPATVDGLPVESWKELTLRFQLRA